MPVIIESKTAEFKERHHAALRGVMPVIGEMYLASMGERFIREGNGDWVELAPRTQKERAEEGFGPAHPILRRLEILYGALTRGNSGNVFEIEDTTVVVGIGGGDMHPGYNDNAGSTRTIGEIALMQHHGIGVPARPILVDPDEPTLESMQRKIMDALTAEVI